jgi:hypothetical protein
VKKTRQTGRRGQKEEEIPMGLANEEIGKQGMEQAKKKGKNLLVTQKKSP